ncbi:hypothetical protein OG21DRAFT_1491954 [Imleria badia]|nr:hypothetical protein OG21DRAFT_1491954 [Imleria badia]
MSYTPLPTSTKSKMTPMASSKRKRAVDDDVSDGMENTSVSGSGGDALRSLAGIVDEEMKNAFSEDRTWPGSSYLAEITTLEGRRILQDYAYLWLVFATAFEQNLTFGPRNIYNARNPSLVADFVVEQWGVRPEQVMKVASGGAKVIRYLLTFDEGDKRKLLVKFPRSWIKLARGLGCRVICPSEAYRCPFPAMVTHVPAGLCDLAIKATLERESFIHKVTEFRRVVLENGVKTDRIEVMVKSVETEGAPVAKNKEDFSYKFNVNGFCLELTRRHLCTTCGEDSHLSSECLVRQRLVSADVKSWSFVDPEKSGQAIMMLPTEPILPVEDVNRIVGDMLEEGESAKTGAEKVGKKKKASKKRKGDDGPPEKKARV